MSRAWREHPGLKGRFHPDFPDDLQVIVHDGGPHFTAHAPELVWVTVTAANGEVFSGRVLNQPSSLANVRPGDEIRFIVAQGSQHPILALRKYLSERCDWVIGPCESCGFSELFDAPSDLVQVQFSNQPDVERMEAFTARCPLCGGTQIVESKQ